MFLSCILIHLGVGFPELCHSSGGCGAWPLPLCSLGQGQGGVRVEGPGSVVLWVFRAVRYCRLTLTSSVHLLPAAHPTYAVFNR